MTIMTGPVPLRVAGIAPFAHDQIDVGTVLRHMAAHPVHEIGGDAMVPVVGETPHAAARAAAAFAEVGVG